MNSIPDLSRVQRIQAAFDAENDNYPTAITPEGKRHHTSLHLGKLLGKVMTVEERAEHGELDTNIIENEVIGDLVIFAAQYAEVIGIDLEEAYISRLMDVAIRNGNGVESAERALQTE